MKQNIKLTVVILCLLIANTTQAGNLVFTPINVSHGLSDNQIRYILQLADGRMVFVTLGNVNIYDGARFSYIHRSSENIYALNKYDGHYRTYQGNDLLWIKDRHKLMCIDLRQEKYISGEDLYAYFKDIGIEEPVENLFMDADQHLWVLTAGGLKQQGSSTHFDLSLNEGELQDIDTDKNQLYLFYNTGEVVCYDIETGTRLYSRAAYPVAERSNFSSTSLVVKGPDGFYQLRNGNKSGFFFFNPSTQTWKKISEEDHGYNTLIVTPDNLAYITTIQGIWIYDLTNDSHQYVPVLKTTGGDVISTEISTIFSDRQGGLWVGSVNRGLLYYHPSRYKFMHYGRVSFTDVLPAEDIIVRAFAEDNKGNIYLRNQSKYYQYCSLTSNGKMLNPISPTILSEDVRNQLDQYSGSRVYDGKHYTALYTDIRGWVWAGTSDGLRLFKPNQKEEVFYTEDGLSNNFVHAILKDRNQNIWVTTSNGISQIHIDAANHKIRFTNFNTHDGTLKGEYAEGAAFEATDGTLYFGGIDGFNVLYPESLSTSPTYANPVFVGIRLRGEPVKPGNVYDGRIILSQTPPYTTELELSYNQNFLTFEYSALNYQNPSHTTYRYKLEGLDTDWQEASLGKQDLFADNGGILQIPYTNLQPGKYTLKVMSSDGNRKWDGSISELNILVHAPWWKTTAAYIIYLLLVLITVSGCVYLYIYITNKKLERKHKEEILLLRIRNLIEQCNQYEAGLITASSEIKDQPEDQTLSSENETIDAVDSAFLARAMEYVEKNLDVTAYSVEQLSRDLCMDRTGLYRKLIALLDESPSTFIRNIRLRRAAQLILDGELSITEIAERVGFNSHSYMSKCFVEMYGCRPSEYAGKMKKST